MILLPMAIILSMLIANTIHIGNAETRTQDEDLARNYECLSAGPHFTHVSSSNQAKFPTPSLLVIVISSHSP